MTRTTQPTASPRPTADEIAPLRTALSQEREALEKAERERDEARQYCSAAYHDYTKLLHLLATEEDHPFEELFKATAVECRETSEFLRLASRGESTIALWENELTKAKIRAAAAEAFPCRGQAAAQAVRGCGCAVRSEMDARHLHIGA